MSSPLFDPNKIKVEDIFRAKEAHRQHLARLPFEEKIKIVEKLNKSLAAAMKNEKLIFESFLKACPDFAGEPIAEWDVVEEWYVKRTLEPPPPPFDKRPDVIAVTTSGKKIGVELKSWVNRDQIAEARKQERIQESILNAIGQLPNETEHIGKVWLSPNQVSVKAPDVSGFRNQLVGLIDQVDRDWSKTPDGDKRPYKQKDKEDFARFPLIERYLRYVRFYRTDGRRLHEWILFPESPGGQGSYSPKAMLETLRTSLVSHRCDERYKDLRSHVGLDEVYLLIHYDFKAFAYNTPFDAPLFGFREAADLASRQLDGDRGYFDRIFLFHFLWGQEEAHELLGQNLRGEE